MADPKQKPGRFTYADYLTWTDDEERWELIDGVAYDMSPAPGRRHQWILGQLFRAIADITDRQGYETYVAPFDVRLAEPGAADDEVTTVVQPDVSVYCGGDKLDDRGAHDAPDLVVEILSPSTSYKDQTHKLARYERAGVREYWIVNGEAAWVMVYRLQADGRYAKPDYYEGGEPIESGVLDGTVEAPDASGV
ncbi:MAG: Uma2 family endonuclease [Spirochaetota bacterium]